jgi:hypothetical protein
VLVLLQHVVLVVNKCDRILNTGSTIVDMQVIALCLSTMGCGNQQTVGHGVNRNHVDCVLSSALKIWNQS